MDVPGFLINASQNLTNDTFIPYVRIGETKASFCLRNCYSEIGTEVIRAVPFNNLFIFFLAVTLIGGLVCEFYLRKITKENEVLARDIRFKHIRFFIYLIWFLSAGFLAVYLRFKTGWILGF